MKIRVMGTEAECQAAREYYRGLEKESGVKSIIFPFPHKI